jgi:hypothetical protein
MASLKKEERLKDVVNSIFPMHVQVNNAIIILLVKNHRTTIYRTTIHLL